MAINYQLFSIESPDSLSSATARSISKALVADGVVGIAIRGACPIGPEDIKNWVDGLTEFGEHEYSAIHGIIKNYGVGQAPFMWTARDWLFPIYAKIWTEFGIAQESLLTSFDGANLGFYRPANKNLRPEKWLHRDQKPQDNDFQMFQGVLELGNRTPGGGGNLVVLPRSHKFETIEHASKHWYRITEEDYIRHNVTPAELIDCYSPHPVTLWLWDSRTWHANRPPLVPDTMRTACYVCIGPSNRPAPESKRLEYIATGVTTSHWPGTTSKNPPPRFYHQTENYLDPKTIGCIATMELMASLKNQSMTGVNEWPELSTDSEAEY